MSECETLGELVITTTLTIKKGPLAGETLVGSSTVTSTSYPAIELTGAVALGLDAVARILNKQLSDRLAAMDNMQ